MPNIIIGWLPDLTIKVQVKNAMQCSRDGCVLIPLQDVYYIY